MGSESLKGIRAIGFDVDGNLYPSTQEMNEWFKSSIVRVAAELLGKTPDEFAPQYFARLQEVKGNTKTLTSFGLDGPAIFDKLWEEIPLEQFVRPDARLVDMFSNLAMRYTLFLISNGRSQTVQHKLEVLGLDSAIFNPFIACYDHGWVKPEPEPFHTALDQLKMPPEQVVYVGDRVDVDIVPAQSVGMRAILAWGTSPLADASIKTIYDLNAIL